MNEFLVCLHCILNGMSFVCFVSYFILFSKKMGTCEYIQALYCLLMLLGRQSLKYFKILKCMLFEIWYVSLNQKGTVPNFWQHKIDSNEVVYSLKHLYLLCNYCKTLVVFFCVSLRLVCTCCASIHILVKWYWLRCILCINTVLTCNMLCLSIPI